jgi:hypothetical protein
VGQYVSRGGKQYYKGDDCKLYANFQGAAAAQNNPNSVENMFGRGFVQTVQGIPSTVQGAFANVGALLDTPIMRAAVGAPQKGPYDEGLNAPTPAQRAKSSSGQYQVHPRETQSFPLETRTDNTRVQGLDRSGNIDRTQSDTYKQYAQTPQGQFQRYFETSEMDPYFGAASRGPGAPVDVNAMEALAGQAKAPVGTPLADYYRSQSAAGRGSMGEITTALSSIDPRYQKGGALEKWAQANPMLAMREFNRQFPTGAPTTGPSDEAIRAAMSGGTYFSSEGSPSPITNPPDFGTPVNKVPAPPTEQGAAVSAPFRQAQQKAANNTLSSDRMPNFLSPGKTFLDGVVGQALKANAMGTFINATQGFWPSF